MRESKFWSKLNDKLDGRNDCIATRIENSIGADTPDVHLAIYPGRSVWLELKAPKVSETGRVDMRHFTAGQRDFLYTHNRLGCSAYLLTYARGWLFRHCVYALPEPCKSLSWDALIGSSNGMAKFDDLMGDELLDFLSGVGNYGAVSPGVKREKS